MEMRGFGSKKEGSSGGGGWEGNDLNFTIFTDFYFFNLYFYLINISFFKTRINKK